MVAHLRRQFINLFRRNTQDHEKNNPKFIGLSDFRLFHSGVAQNLANLAREVFNMKDGRAVYFYRTDTRLAYAFFVENQTDHEHEGGRILNYLGFNWAEAVFNHGDSDVDDWTDEIAYLKLSGHDDFQLKRH